ncbi:hypothetical protein [Pseudomonas sp. DY-1]|nr:hypothetical protein [Pseudomonas sp. DY-1]
MLNYLLDVYDGLKDGYHRWRKGPPPVRHHRTPSQTPTPSPQLPDAASVHAAPRLPALKSWSHPFGDKSNPLVQLTNLAKAQAGYFPLGRNGMWHGGVHFDSGTAGTVGTGGQSEVRCLADGEVVAYRIPERTPTTTYFPAPGVTVQAPFASGFVLVRHRLEAPTIEGNLDTPPSLVFYSLYMHLHDWESYKSDPSLARPAFWPEGAERRVKQTANDTRAGRPGQRGLNVRSMAHRGAVIDLLPCGATVTVSGEGNYRKLENVRGPSDLIASDGTMQGYVFFDLLKDIGGGVYRVDTQQDHLTVRAAPHARSHKIGGLPRGSEVTISGDGDFRKLESVAQYVHLDSLESERVPQVSNSAVVLDQPVPIKASELIGHLGPYQEGTETAPQKKLHLEVFTADDVATFFAACRAWAEHLPSKEKTWLKLAKGTLVITHQSQYCKTSPPSQAHPGTPSGADLLVPRVILDGLASEQKIELPRTDDRNAFNWYRLDGLLNDDQGNLLDGWVREEVGVTPWVSPWSWEGFDVIYNDDPPHNALAYFLQSMSASLADEAIESNRARADKSDRGPVRSRLYEIIDTNRDGRMTAEELQAALRIPAHAQSISQLVIHYESEWYYQERKWDALDKVLGHTTSAPILNWVVEKERIKQLSWWEGVAEKVKLPKEGGVYHLHPIELMAFGSGICPQECIVDSYSMETPVGILIVSKESFDFILEMEGYEEYPYVPAGISGVTVGYGYDLGQQTVGQVRDELGEIYTPQSLERLLAVVGRKGESARTALCSVSDISISKEKAGVLAVKMKKRYARLVLDAYPELTKLHPHCQGSILSLVINRGSDFYNPNPASRVEMKQIAEDLATGQEERVPGRIRSMKRLWEGKPGLGGVIVRREQEAKLFERGLKCNCWQ